MHLQVWTPDIFLFNDVTGHFGDELMRSRPYLVIGNLPFYAFIFFFL